MLLDLGRSVIRGEKRMVPVRTSRLPFFADFAIPPVLFF